MKVLVRNFVTLNTSDFPVSSVKIAIAPVVIQLQADAVFSTQRLLMRRRYIQMNRIF